MNPTASAPTFARRHPKTHRQQYGEGGEWAAGMPLVLEHWPARRRGVASGLLQGGWEWGFILSALVFTFIYPSLTPYGDFAWRAMFLDRRRAGALRALDTQECRGESSLARASEASARDAAKGRGLAVANLPTRPASDDPADIGADRKFHGVLLLDLVLVRYVPARAGAFDTVSRAAAEQMDAVLRVG